MTLRLTMLNVVLAADAIRRLGYPVTDENVDHWLNASQDQKECLAENQVS